MSPPPVGIDTLGVAFPRAYIALEDLAYGRSVSPSVYSRRLGTIAMAVPEPDEDTITLAAAAAADALARAELDPSDIGLCIVGTETGVDAAKPVAAHLQGLVGLPATCRTFEAKHSSYGGTAGLMCALDWVRSGSSRGRKALVVCADVARHGIGTPDEPTQGAGAVALVVGEHPRVVEIDTTTIGTSSRHVLAGAGSDSLAAYLDALRGAYEEHRRLSRAPITEGAATLYHAPYPTMARAAHRLVCELEGVADVDDAFERLVATSLLVPERIGNVHTASLYLSLASVLACSTMPLGGRSVSFFSYGSGSCAELFRGKFVTGARRMFGMLTPRLAARRRLNVTEYERMLRAHDELGSGHALAPVPPPARTGRLEGAAKDGGAYA